MTWLLWKEYRLNRPIVFVMLFLMILPHLVVIYMALRYAHRGVTWLEGLPVASFYSFLLSQVALALIGGNAIAGERADRSAEFQAYLPLTRGKILAGKLLLALAIAAVIWLTNPPILWSLVQERNYGPPELLRAFCNTAITGLTFFCVAWLFSSFLASPTFSVCAGLIAPLLVVSGLAYIAYLLDIPPPDNLIEASYRSICLVTAPVCFAVGTWLYLRRVEP
jgi:ABC-type transport system involved in multi-copper enzyme maturation permease subunit